MADNVLYTQGTGTTIATDDVSGAHYQKVKLDVGKDGVTLGTDGSLPVYIVSGVALTIVGIQNTIDTELSAAETLQDSDTNPFVPNVGAFTMGWNGSTWDRLRTNSLATGQLMVIVSGTVEGFTGPDLPANYKPMLFAGVSEDSEDTAPTNIVDAEGDITRPSLSRDGAVYTRPHPPRIWHYTQEFTSAITDYNIHSGLTNLSHYIGTIYYVASGTVFAWIKDGVTSSSPIKWKYYAGGVGDGVTIQFNPPLKMTANTHVGFSTMGTCFLSVSGYTAV